MKNQNRMPEFIDWDIIERSFSEELTEDESIKLDSWLKASQKHVDFYNSAMKGGSSDPVVGLSDYDMWLQKRRLMNRIRNSSLIRKRVFRIAKYAAIFIIPIALFFGSKIYIESREAKITKLITSNLMPGTSKARLILEGGREVLISDKQNYNIGNNIIINGDKGEITYDNVQKKSNSIHTLIVPKGGEYRLVLSDNSIVTLNSESEIQFAENMNGHERVVSLSGEAYFEISKDKARPFIINSQGLRIKVTGTSFNVTSYNDMSKLSVIVDEGSVDVDFNSNKYKLTETKKISIDKTTGAIEISDVNKGIGASWKEGYFYFDKENLSDIMKRLSRWYDVRITINGTALSSLRFVGNVEKYSTIDKVLEVLELTGNFRYKAKHGEIIIDNIE